MPAFAPLKEKNHSEKNEEKPSDVIIPAVVASVILLIIRKGSIFLMFENRQESMEMTSQFRLYCIDFIV